MKKIVMLAVSVVLCLGLAACGSSDKAGSDEPDAPKIEKTVDAVAAELGFTGEKQEKAFDMVEATDGAGYDGYEIYIYDEDSDAYKAITGDGYELMGIMLQSSASNSGVVLIYSGEGDADQTIIDTFNQLNFK